MTYMNQDTRVIKDIFFLFTALCSLSIFNKINSKILIILGINFLFIGVLNRFLMTSSIGLFQYINLFIGLGLISQFAYYWQNTRKIFNQTLAICCVMNCIWVFTEYFDYDPRALWGVTAFPKPFREGGLWPINGALNNRMVTSAYIAMLSPFLFQRKWWVLIPMPIIALYLLNSATGMIGISVVYLYFLTRFLWKWLKFNPVYPAGYVLSIFGCGLVAFKRFHPYFYDSGRYESWVQIWHGLKKPWFGYGPGWFTDKGIELATRIPNLHHPHNEFLDSFIKWGISGNSIICIVLILIFMNHEREPMYFASFCAFLVGCFTSFPLHISSSALIIIICVGVFWSYFDEKQAIKAAFDLWILALNKLQRLYKRLAFQFSWLVGFFFVLIKGLIKTRS